MNHPRTINQNLQFLQFHLETSGHQTHSGCRHIIRSHFSAEVQTHMQKKKRSVRADPLKRVKHACQQTIKPIKTSQLQEKLLQHPSRVPSEQTPSSTADQKVSTETRGGKPERQLTDPNWKLSHSTRPVSQRFSHSQKQRHQGVTVWRFDTPIPAPWSSNHNEDANSGFKVETHHRVLLDVKL